MDLVKEYLLWVRVWPWAEIRSLFELLLYFLAIVAVLGCLMRLGMIRKIIREFQDARSPIWDMRGVVRDLRELEPVMRALSERVSLMDEKVEAVRMQAAELQVESISTRTDGLDGVAALGLTPEIAQGFVPPRPADEDPNWLALRDLWRRNTQRLEYVIEHRITDGRTRIAYDRLPRTNYERIINKLQGQKFVSAASADASRFLNDTFNKYRPRNRKVPDEVIGGLRTLDQQLDAELVPFAKLEEADVEDRPPEIAVPAQPNQANGSGEKLIVTPQV
ncbi:MAG: hypothetical protein K8F92_02505 [Hyphomicrobium sp.]|uniref:hypothetical protein n=1 Tax=Hyphomicrobium sp. TaxID=82 RepID=UPI0013222FDC|nr:hypothetical protein [Hyphomicrobium sp.]KAB2942542.1 MAG: hypothetical protein F9K20_06015 [Hyphomicrobium sp.]MBZ0208513.1 hypothetical protein [Hyphomicrobium sp.]